MNEDGSPPEPTLSSGATAVPVRQRAGRKVILAAGIVASVLTLVGWRIHDTNHEAVASASPAESRRGPFLDGTLIRFSDDYSARNGITTVAVKLKEIEPTVNVNGAVTHDPRKFAAVGARIPGRVRRVLKTVGDPVRANEALAEIESAELGKVEAQALTTRAKEMAAEAQMKRDRRLADARITSERDAELSKAEYDAVRAERRAAEQAVKALGGSLNDQVGTLVLRSPIAGKLVSAKVARGQTVEPADTLFEVADLSTVWVELRIFERDLASMQVGDAVEITTQASPPQLVKGQVSHVGDILDPETRSATVRVMVENERRLLRPGQSVHARIQTTMPTGSFLGIPRAAVTRVDGKATVFLLMGKGAVEPRSIKIGLEDAQDVAVLEGLRAGDQVIVGGLFELKSELFR